MKSRIKEIIKKEFKAKTKKITRITEGFSHFMYEVETNKPPYEIIVRFSNNTAPFSNLSKEKFVIDLLRKNKIPVPKVYAYHFPEDKKEEGYMIIEKFQGNRLDLIWKELSEEEKILITTKIGKLLSDIHKIKFEHFGNIEENGKIDFDEPFKFRKLEEEIFINPSRRNLLKQTLTDLSRLSTHDEISIKFLTDYLRYILDNKNLFDYDEKPSLLHMDLFPGHIFIEKIDGEYKIIGIIDFELAKSGNPDQDFIKLHRNGFFDMPKLKKALDKGYGKNLDKQKIEFNRMQRDFAFAAYIFESGGKELAKKVLSKIETSIDKYYKKEGLDFFKFP